MAGGCQPKYPACERDEHCRKGEFCVNRRCQQCRSDADCAAGKACRSGRCEPKGEYCDTAEDCPEGQVCIAHQCAPCRKNADCGEGGHCKAGRCLPRSCQTDEDCPENHECQNGRCVAPPSAKDAHAACTPQPIYFGFDEFVLSDEATRRLHSAATCINSVAGRRIRLEGHCDPRGTDEYNLALGDRRAHTVRNYLRRLGVDVTRLRVLSKGRLEAVGTDAAGWATDRRVQFNWE